MSYPLPEAAFHTVPRPEEPIRFVVYGDVRSGHAAHAELVEAILDEAPDFVVSTGDMVLSGSDEGDWQRFFQVAAGLLARIPTYPVIGNHDVGTAGDQHHLRRFEDIFALWPGPADRPDGAAWYGFDVGAVHFVMLDSNRYHDERQLAWLEADLAAARAAGARAIFAATHHGPYARGPHGGSAVAAERYVPLLARAGVAALFSGHDHFYQRGRVGGLTYVVFGGGGAPLYQPRCGVAGKRACRKDGAQLVTAEHHHVALEVHHDYVKMCPRRPDGTLVEECTTLSLAR